MSTSLTDEKDEDNTSVVKTFAAFLNSKFLPSKNCGNNGSISVQSKKEITPRKSSDSRDGRKFSVENLLFTIPVGFVFFFSFIHVYYLLQ